MSAKDAAIKVVEAMPDDATLEGIEDALRELFGVPEPDGVWATPVDHAKEAVLDVIRSLPDETTPDVIRCEVDRLHDGEALTDEEWEAEWGEEIERRIADHEAGRTVGVPWEDVMRRLREKFG